ncbi:MAG: helix-hairpin-helix domain-containing protein [Clostridiales bacterium]|nr:helix-hairpin-helix domain-containing protein [Candidatus Crickella equi]
MKTKTKISFDMDEVKGFFKKLLENKKLVGKIALIVLILIFALVIRINNAKDDEVQVEVNDSINTTKVVAEMYVDISGEVNNPGVYQVDSDTRMYEVIKKAGGLTDDADTDQINQADFVEDGEKIIIPSINDEVSADDSEVGSVSDGISSSALININKASKEQLMEITGVGEVIAQRIIDYRKTNRFKSKEDIMNVSGIGEATYEKMKSQICI